VLVWLLVLTGSLVRVCAPTIQPSSLLAGCSKFFKPKRVLLQRLLCKKQEVTFYFHRHRQRQQHISFSFHYYIPFISSFYLSFYPIYYNTITMDLVNVLIWCVILCYNLLLWRRAETKLRYVEFSAFSLQLSFFLTTSIMPHHLLTCVFPPTGHSRQSHLLSESLSI
jgi:hypothetical protein